MVVLGDLGDLVQEEATRRIKESLDFGEILCGRGSK